MRTGAHWPARRPCLVLCLAVLAGCQGVSVRRVVFAPRVRQAAPRAESASAVPSVRAPLEALAGSLAALGSLPPAPATEEQACARSREVLAQYNAALEGLLRRTGGRTLHPDEDWRRRLASLGVRVAEPVEGGAALWDPARFDDLLFADDYVVRGMEHPHRLAGLGVPMIAVRRFEADKRRHGQGQERFLMPREVYPVTAVLRAVPPGGANAAGPLEWVLELRDPLAGPHVALAGRDRPLAADLTTPLAYHFARTPLPVLQEVGLLEPGWLDDLQGLYMLHPYRPGKIPIVFVHGLRSTPLAWLKVINEIWGDPVLRERYQVWLYVYPTGKPLPSTAATLRDDLGESRHVIDPGHADPALDRMVLVGHSMGGLISKMMIQESGDALWRLFSNRPFEELRIPPDRRAALRRSLFFGAVPSVARIVFIATPHRGSELGDELIGRITDRLIRLPRTLRSTYRALLAANGPEAFTPLMRRGMPTSIDELGLDNPFLTTLARLPRRTDVPVHSIIGRQDPDTPLLESSDGVVPYVSAHIDWAESECVVTGGHMCQDLPETIREIRRILHLHLGAGAPASILRR